MLLASSQFAAMYSTSMKVTYIYSPFCDSVEGEKMKKKWLDPRFELRDLSHSIRVYCPAGFEALSENNSTRLTLYMLRSL